MKKILLLGTIFVATGAFAFGGMGVGHMGGRSSSYKAGVDAIGVHIRLNNTNSPNIVLCGDNEESWQEKCLSKCPDGLQRNTDGSCTVCQNGNVYLSYKTDPCSTDASMTGNCKSNKDCSIGEFCNLTDTTWGDLKPDGGECTAIGVKDVDYNDVEVEGLGTVRMSATMLTWWAAENWCKAQGKELINISSFECYQTGTNNLMVANSEGGSCCKGENAECGDWTAYWTSSESKDIEEGYEDIVASKYSAVMVDLRKKFGGDAYIWTDSQYPILGAPEMFAYVLYARYGSADYAGRSGLGNVLCK